MSTPADNIEQQLFAGSGIDAAVFYRDYWMKKPLFIPRDEPARFGALMTRKDIDELLTSRNARFPEVSMSQAGKVIARESYTQRQIINEVVIHRILAERVAALFANGVSLLLRTIHTGMPSARRFAVLLEEFFQTPMEGACYISPPNAASIARHTDDEATIVVQIEGRKHWLIARDVPSGAPGIVTMAPGSVLYLPPAWPHFVTSADNIAISLNYSILMPTWRMLLHEASADLLAAPAFDRLADLAHGDGVADDVLAEMSRQAMGTLTREQWIALARQDFVRRRIPVHEAGCFSHASLAGK